MNKVDKEKTDPDNNRPSHNIIIGNIVERTEGVTQSNVEQNAFFDDSKGFPRPERIDQKVIFG